MTKTSLCPKWLQVNETDYNCFIAGKTLRQI